MFAKNLNWKILVLIGVFVLAAIIFIIVLFNIEIKKTTTAILEVDGQKNLSLQFTTSNINLLSEQKDLAINLEGKTYYLHDVEFIYVGNNQYRITFENEDLYHLVKTNSLYNVEIFSGSKKIVDYIFNI